MIVGQHDDERGFDQGQTNQLHDINWGALDHAFHVRMYPMWLYTLLSSQDDVGNARLVSFKAFILKAHL